jgi:hypothetical protein
MCRRIAICIHKMRTGIKSIPYSLFTIPLAATALSLANVKAHAENVKPKRVTVIDPNGHIHTFPNETLADNFRKAAGIK